MPQPHCQGAGDTGCITAFTQGPGDTVLWESRGTGSLGLNKLLLVRGGGRRHLQVVWAVHLGLNEEESRERRITGHYLSVLEHTAYMTGFLTRL